MIECSLGQQAMLICVDSYEGGVPRGRLYLPGQPGQRFDSLSQLLLRGGATVGAERRRSVLHHSQNFRTGKASAAGTL